MDELDFTDDIAALRSTFADIRSVVDVDSLQSEIARLSEEAGVPDLWDDPEKAQKVTSALSHRQSELARITSIENRLDDLEIMVQLANEEQDAAAAADARTELAAISATLGDLEVQTLLDGEYDNRPAVITIRAGAGGVDAADFADMLLRMYLRWAEKHKYPVTVMDTSYAEEAGIKSATFEVDAPYAFGTLSVEAGTHRLVRMSPFGAAGKRQTSFAAVEVIPLLEEATGRPTSRRTTSASTSSGRPARAASPSTRPTRRCASPTSRPGSSCRCRTRRARSRTGPRP
jgi:peptide chain release factor 2